MSSAGFPPNEIDTVLCTHMHVDHVGWNTRLENGRWVPTFSRARYLFGRKEWAHWKSAEPSHFGDVIGDSIQLEPTPGHTPGHVSVRIRSQGAEALITSDIMHHPIQCASPKITCIFDFSPEEAYGTRAKFLAETVGTPVLVLGLHFANPTGGRIVADGEAYRFLPE